MLKKTYRLLIEQIHRLFGLLPAQTRVFFLCLALVLSVFQIFRLAFLILHWNIFTGDTPSDILISFLIGVRFDLHIALVIMGLFFLLLHIPGGWKKHSILSQTLLWIPVPIFLLSFALMLIDLHYYSEAGRHLAQEIFLATGNIDDFTSSMLMIAQYRWSILFYAVLAPVFIYIWRWATRPARFRKESPGFIRETIVLVGFFLFFGLGVRGTLEPKPLKTGHAFSQGKVELGHLALNAVFTVARTLVSGEGEVVNFYPAGDAIETVRDLLDIDPKFPVSDKFPVFRHHDPANNGTSGKKPNIVLIVMESWGGKFIGAMGAPVKATPVFDDLAQSGLLFTDFYANGRRSQEAMAAIIMGVPLFSDMDIFTSGLEQNNYRGLGRIFAEQGYETVFMHGGKVGTLGLNGFAKIAGFARYIGMEDLDLKPDDYDGAWGVYDHAMAGHVNDELRSLREPFFLLWFTLSSHEPFRIPDGFPRIQSNGTREGKMYNALHYSDYSLGEFFKKARVEGYFENTVFILVGDHSAGKNLVTPRERHQVPLLVYSPGRFEPGRVTKVGSQMDLIPTIMDVAGIPGDHHSFGNSMFGDGRRYAFVNLGSIYGWLQKDRVLTVNTDGSSPMLYDYNTNKPMKGDPSQELKEILSFVQVSKTLIRDNRLAPMTGSPQPITGGK
ncbi:MAG: LTA synthase family protein [bacterium]